MGRGIKKKRAKKAESEAGQGLGLVVEKFLGWWFELLQTQHKNRKKIDCTAFLCLKLFILKFIGRGKRYFNLYNMFLFLHLQ